MVRLPLKGPALLENLLMPWPSPRSCVKHRNKDESTAHFENASGFSISKGDFSAIRGHRYGGLRISGKMIVIHQGTSRSSSARTKIPQYRPGYHGHQDESDSDASTTSSISSGSTAMLAHSKPRHVPRRLVTPVYAERRASLEDGSIALKQRRRELEEESQAMSCHQQELEAREARLRALEAEATLREQLIHAREQDLDARVQAARVRQDQLEEKEKALKHQTLLIKGKGEEILQRESLVQGVEMQLGTRITALDDREASLDQRERDLALRERDVQTKDQDLERREEIVRKTQEELRQTEREILALETRIKEQLEAMQEKCAQLRRVRERFSAHRDGWLAAAATKAAEFVNIEKELDLILGDFSRRKRTALPPILAIDSIQ
ncbi:hypothetical protein FA13DRAFT_1714745 [Coprinellus micaceus]|uniref:Uncharacterized protein n=1 Tax=Coprinellus micaceus TaxID=71717 RepID=A0A4Y7SQW7_COPMI|nr:hypothetical protein FA13DRAFT_1714745 [Coprinellus micaceus]